MVCDRAQFLGTFAKEIDHVKLVMILRLLVMDTAVVMVMMVMVVMVSSGAGLYWLLDGISWVVPDKVYNGREVHNQRVQHVVMGYMLMLMVTGRHMMLVMVIFDDIWRVCLSLWLGLDHLHLG